MDKFVISNKQNTAQIYVKISQMSKKFTKKRKDNEMTMKITTMMFNFAIQKILIMNFINKVSRKMK